MCPAAKSNSRKFRRRWHILGQVQGVGYRPFVYRLAHRLNLGGFVLNDGGGVTVEAQGTAVELDQFSRALRDERPALALIDQVTIEHLQPAAQQDSVAFRIISSLEKTSNQDGGVRAAITVDAAVCDACLSELNSPGDRRYCYGLTNCTDCGPRYTIIDRVPYDRPNTSMQKFTMCPDCHKEYTNPSDRRYHAQPIACHHCGPVVELVDPRGDALPGDPMASAAALLAAGKIVAVQGLGGFHLAVRADDQATVMRLRSGKQRDSKPFAVICRSIEAAQRLARLSDRAIMRLGSAEAPIVLAPRRQEAAIAPGVAPDSHRLGVMLPYTPIQHVLFTEMNGGVQALVMTSANPSDEPLTIDHDEAVSRLGGLCDAILWHDRPIRRRVDDSVLLDMGRDSEPLPVRRARGYVPTPIALPVGGHTPGLCVGGELKNTIALVRDGQATLSQHLGDLSYTPVFEHFKSTCTDLLALFDAEPRWIAHDLHPMYLGTRYAKSLARALDVPLIGVQHHHAHAAAVMAEHGVTEPVLALVCDGVGYGDDGTSWGGELLLADLVSYKRLARLRPIRLPGGDAAAYDTRRCALALLHQVYREGLIDHPATERLIKNPDERRLLCDMLLHDVNCTTSSACGRYFDGVTALLGLSTSNDHEAQSAMRLEASAYQCARSIPSGSLFRNIRGEPGTIDLSALIDAMVVGVSQGTSDDSLAALFHDQLAWALADAAQDASRRLGINTVALTGGVFCNQRLTHCLAGRLSGDGLRVLVHQKVPANDGGLALGQAAVASAQIEQGNHRKAGVQCV